MPNNRRYLSLKAVCPYYKSEEKQIIYCKGFKPDTALHIAFAYPADKVEFKEQYCESKYESCKIAKTLEEGTND